MTRYLYIVQGGAADGQTWESQGTVQTEKEGEFPRAVLTALQDSFEQLTQGKAVYGQPGVGCHGPYKIRRLVIERVEEQEEVGYGTVN